MKLFPIFLSIISLFFLFLLVRELIKGKIKENFCVICVSVSITWITLLLLYKLNMFDNQIILALLIGESTVGLFYMISSFVKKKYKLFKLPFLLTLILTGYSLIEIPDDLVKIIVLLLSLWAIFSLLFYYKNNETTKKAIDKIIECCKDW